MSELRTATRLLAALIGLWVAAAPVAFDPAAAAPVTEDVRSAIGAVEAAQAKAWNEHDARGYAALFTADADVVNVLGWRWTGRDEVETKLRRAFASVFARSRMTIDDVAVRSLAPDLAVAHVGWSMSGAMSPDGSGANVPQRGVQTQVLRRDGGRWLIVAFQNTNAVPERDFPSADAAAIGSTARGVPIGGPTPVVSTTKPAASTTQPASANQPASATRPASAAPPAPLGRCLVGTSGGTCLMRGKPPKPVP